MSQFTPTLNCTHSVANYQYTLTSLYVEDGEKEINETNVESDSGGRLNLHRIVKTHHGQRGMWLMLEQLEGGGQWVACVWGASHY